MKPNKALFWLILDFKIIIQAIYTAVIWATFAYSTLYVSLLPESDRLLDSLIKLFVCANAFLIISKHYTILRIFYFWFWPFNMLSYSISHCMSKRAIAKHML